MIAPLDKLDKAILNFCTKFSHNIQRNIGLTCYFIARIGVAFTAISVIADVINYYHQFLPNKSIMANVVIGGLIMVSCFLRSLACQKAEDSIGSNTKPAALLLYTQGGFWRLIWLGFLCLDLATTAVSVFGAHHTPLIATFEQHVFFSLGLSLFYYFIAVDPLPPGTSKVREWFDNLGRQPVPVTVREN